MSNAVLFDIDGVLLDSFEAGLKFFGDIFTRLGRRPPTRARYKRAFHLPFIRAMEHMARAELTEELERIHEAVRNAPYHKELLKEPPHCKETLRKLKQSYKLGVVTSRGRDSVNNRYFSFARTEKYFDVCVTVENVTHPKPNPEPLLLAAKKLKLRPSECVYVGDAPTDIEAGKAAGMKTILYGGKKHTDADAATKTFKKLPEIVAALFSRQ